MAIFRGTGGSGSSSDSTIVDAVTAQATIATTKAGEASTSATTATTKASEASASATTATNKATEANASATTAEDNKDLCVSLRGETLGLAQDALASADAAEASATTANSSAVQTVAGSNTQVVGVYNNIANVNTVAGVNTDVTTVAGISSDVTTVAADASDIGTVSTNIANVNNVGNNIANVNAVHGNASNINTVAADGTDIGTVATNIANVNTVAGISSNVTTVAGLESKMDTVIADASDIGAVAGNIGDVTTVAGINSDVDTVAGIAAKVTTVADNISDVQAADTNATNAASSASNASASATSASNSATTATTKATEASNSATAASNSATTATTKASQAAGSATTAGTSASTATTKASEASASATTATTKAGEAASSASAASGDATTAVTKASEASASAASAATSATNSSNAASTWNNFYTTYLGPADAPPTADVLGNALQTGAFYYDTGAGSNTVGLYVYNGSSWVYSTNYNNVTAPYSLAQDLATNSHDISFGDNAKAKFGAGADLQIYHDGTSNKIVGSIDVTGTATMDGLTVDGSGTITNTAAGVATALSLKNNTSGANNRTAIDLFTANTKYVTLEGGYGASAPTFNLKVGNPPKLAMSADGNGDISFYEDTGTTPSLLWDSSATALTITGRESSRSSNTYAFEVDNSAQTSNLSASGSFRVKGNTGDSLVVTGQGNVGIGTTSPSAALDVIGEATIGSGTYGVKLSYSNSATAGVIDTADSADKLSIRTGGSEKMRIDSSGKVGIGTSSPNYSLTSYKVGANANYLQVVNGSSGPNAANGILYGLDGAGNGVINKQGAGDLITSVAGTERMRINSSGNVGIGTSSPKQQLHISGGNQDGDVTKVAIGATGANAETHLQLAERFTGNDMNYGFSFVADGNDTNNLLIKNHNNSTTGAVALSVARTSGNVGIGTTSPDYLLDVEGASGTISSIKVANPDVGLRMSAYTDEHAEIRVETNHPLVFKTNGNNERMRIDASGNVGIGTSSPNQLLSLNSTASTARGISIDQSGAERVKLLYTNSSGSFDINNATAGYTSFSNNGSERMRIDSSGNVLVGTTSYQGSGGSGAKGFYAGSDGLLSSARSGATVAVLNRTTSDGAITEFRKDGTTVGSIGTTGGDMYVGTGDTGIRFDDATNHIRPCGVSGANLDATIDIGDSSRRFKDLYLSGGVKGNNLTFSGNGSSEHARIDSSGNLLVGTTDQYAFNGGVTVQTGTVDYINVGHASSVANGNYYAAFRHGTNTIGTITQNGTTGINYNTSSDERLKENITDSTDAGSKVDAIQIRQFDWKADGSHQDYGVIAQELATVAPEAVHQPEDSEDMMGVDYSKLVPMLIKEVQTLRNRVAQLENK